MASSRILLTGVNWFVGLRMRAVSSSEFIYLLRRLYLFISFYVSTQRTAAYIHLYLPLVGYFIQSGCLRLRARTSLEH